MNPAAEAAREAHRSKTSGRFQEHLHSVSPVTLEAPLSPAQVKRRNLEARAEERAAALVQAKREMNAACCAVAAHNLSEEGLDVGKVLIEGDDKYWFVCEAETPDGDKLDGAATLRIKDAMHEAGVHYETSLRTEGINLSRAQHWTPDGYADEDPDDGPAGYVSRMVTKTDKAMEAAELDFGDPQYMARDMLTNLRHWSDANDVDLDEALRGSYTVYTEEARDAREFLAEEAKANA